MMRGHSRLGLSLLAKKREGVDFMCGGRERGREYP